MRTKKRVTLYSVCVEIFLALFCLFILIPFMWMLTTTLRSPLKAFTLPPGLIPTTFDFSSYALVFKKVNFGAFVWNSIKVSAIVTACQMIVSSLAAYAFSKLKFPGRMVVFYLFLSSMMIPGAVVTIPRFVFMSRMGLVNTHAALILPGLFSAMSIFLIRQNMLSIPMSFNDAGYIDGASHFRCYRSIIMPMAKPSVVVAGILTFIGSWNDFSNPLIFINSSRLFTLPLGLVSLQGQFGSGNKSSVIAGVLLATIAPVIFYAFGQKYLIEGATLGGLKG